MTRKEAIEMLKKDKEQRGNCFISDALDMAIKALEQEPFMNKLCVAHQVCHEDKVKMLDKIRDEIEFEVDHRTHMLCAEDVFEIIDKYRAESEDE